MTDESGSPRRPAWRSPSRSSPAASSPRSRPRSADSCARRRSPEHDVRTPTGSAVRTPTHASSQPHSSTGPPKRSKRGHHLGGRGLVGGPVERKEDRVGALAQGGAQGHAGVDARSPRLVRRRRHDLTRPRGVAIATDDDRPTTELGSPQHLDRGEELVEVDVQDPLAFLVGGRRQQVAHLHILGSSPRSRTEILRTSSFCANVQPDGCRSGIQTSTASSTPLPTALGATSSPSPSGARTACRRWRSATR